MGKEPRKFQLTWRLGPPSVPRFEAALLMLFYERHLLAFPCPSPTVSFSRPPASVCPGVFQPTHRRRQGEKPSRRGSRGEKLLASLSTSRCNTYHRETACRTDVHAVRLASESRSAELYRCASIYTSGSAAERFRVRSARQHLQRVVSRVARLLRKPFGRCRFLHHVVGLVQVSRRDVFFWGEMSNFRHIPFALPRRFSKLAVALTSTFCAQDCFLLEGTLNPATVIRVEHSED